MKLKDFIEKKQVKRVDRDVSLAKSLVITAETDLNFLKDLEINDNSARKIMSNHCDVLRSILEAISALDGYKIYSHEAFTYFLKEKDEIVIAEKFDRFRKIRNRINYYGKNISIEEVKENVAEITELIVILKIKYLSTGSIVVKVKCGKPETKIVKEVDGVVYLDVKVKPVRGEANREVIKFFSRKFGCSVKIIKGKKSSVKVLRVE